MTTPITYLGSTPQMLPVSFVGGLSATSRLGAATFWRTIVKNVAAVRRIVEKIQPTLAHRSPYLESFSHRSPRNEWVVCQDCKGVLLSEILTSMWAKILSDEVPFVVIVLNADIMATFVQPKKQWGSVVRMSFVGGLEAHLQQNLVVSIHL